MTEKSIPIGSFSIEEKIESVTLIQIVHPDGAGFFSEHIRLNMLNTYVYKFTMEVYSETEILIDFGDSSTPEYIHSDCIGKRAYSTHS